MEGCGHHPDSQRNSSSLQNEWDPVRGSMSNVSLSMSTCSDHLRVLLLDDVFKHGSRWDTTFGLSGNASVTPVHRSIEDRRTPGRRLHREVVVVTC